MSPYIRTLSRVHRRSSLSTRTLIDSCELLLLLLRLLRLLRLRLLLLRMLLLVPLPPPSLLDWPGYF